MRQKGSLFRLSSLNLMSRVSACVLLTILAAPIGMATAQQLTVGAPPATSLSAKTTSGATSSSSPTDERYRIGPGDVIEVRVFNRPQISRDAVRVDGHGVIRMPLIEGEIQAACHTEGELAREIAARYMKYLKNPQIDVFVKEYNSQPVAIVGAVNKPGQFQLQRRIRLLELLSFAGGPSAGAGRSIQIVHTAAVSKCETPPPDKLDEAAEVSLVSYSLSNTLRGEDGSNPYVQPGDIITVLEADQAYIVGNVLKPSVIPLKEPITVSQAIAITGGTLPDTKKDRIRIIRQAPGSTTRTEILVDLKAIDKRRAEDVVLQAGDIVDVPTSTGIQKVVNGILRTVVPTLSQQLPVYVIR